MTGSETPEALPRQAVLDSLWERHVGLDAHYTALRDQRSTPVFALEHGLDSDQTHRTEALVRRAVLLGLIPRDRWLPFVVYATELGYRYEGEEYWSTFEQQTPGWRSYGDRYFIRRSFQRFASAYGGVRPSGAWAEHFSIICWPITHAVLPTDLQRHLARLLYESRYALSPEILADSALLGKELAARAWQTSGRFQHFAQNTDLLGQVAAALLASDADRDSSFLTSATLNRIVGDLSRERQARTWLQRAKDRATEVRLRGFRTVPTQPTSREAQEKSFDPKLALIDVDGRWVGSLEFPDLSPLASRFPELGQALRVGRVEVAGAGGVPMARGRLLYPRQRVLLDRWPSAGAPLIRLERAPENLNALLVDQCVFPPGPVWLFRANETGMAAEVRGKRVQPGRRYLIATRDPAPSVEAPWIARREASTAGMNVFEVEVPSSVSTEEINTLANFGIGVVVNVDVRPVGVVPAAWDRAGTIEWVDGAEMILGVRSDRAPSHCVVSMSGSTELIAWPPGEMSAYLRLFDLEQGKHAIDLALYTHSGGEPVATAALTVFVRQPASRQSSGDVREGLAILADPAQPFLTELWDRQGSLEILGPRGATADVEVALIRRPDIRLFRRAFSMALPVSATEWMRTFQHNVRQSRDAQRWYDEADAVEIAVTNDVLGRVGIKCEREYRPLRWTFRRDEDGPVAKLIDLTDDRSTAIHISPYEHPFRRTPISISEAAEVRSPDGGLLVAASGTSTSSLILPPDVRELEDFSRLVVTPRFPRLTPSVEGVEQLLAFAETWATAESPSEFFAETSRINVTNAFAAEIAALIGGARWRQLEQRLRTDADLVSVRSLVDALGDQPAERRLGVELRDLSTDFVDATAQQRVRLFSRSLRSCGYRPLYGISDDVLAEGLLRLVSNPGSLGTWSKDRVRSIVRAALFSSIRARGARFVVVVVQLDAAAGLSNDQRTMWA